MYVDYPRVGGLYAVALPSEHGRHSVVSIGAKKGSHAASQMISSLSSLACGLVRHDQIGWR